MTAQSEAEPAPLLMAWSQALPRVLALLGEQKRGPFRQELQRYLAASRFQPNDTHEHTQSLAKLLVEAARAAEQPGAISMTRDIHSNSEMVKLCEHLLASWREAEAKGDRHGGCDAADGMSGEVFFGPRLGGAGRPGALRRDRRQETGD